MTLNSQQYHRLTSYQRDKIPQHFLDWQNQPSTFKTYPEAEHIELPKEFSYREDKLSLILKSSVSEEECIDPKLADLSRIFALAYGITGKTALQGGYFYYRSVASAGALYPVEIYVGTKDVRGLPDGIYHYSVAHHALSAIRNGDVSDFVVNALREIPQKHPVLVFFLSVIFFRSAWKYRDRSFRYHLLDTGHLIENLGLALGAQGFPFVLSYDFKDQAFNRLLGFDETKEACLAVAHVPGSHLLNENCRTFEINELDDSIKGASRVSNREVEYNAVRDMYKEGVLQNFGSQTNILAFNPVNPLTEQTIAIEPPDSWPEQMNYKDAFFLRRSRRNFVPKPIPQRCLWALLECLSIDDQRISSKESDYKSSVSLGLIIGNAEGLDPGFYLMDQTKKSLGMVNPGSFTGSMAHICLDQKWLANASVHFLFMTDLEKLDKYYGPRGYRYAMMLSGRLGERLYLSATAMGLGCCGIGAFYDTEAAQILGLEQASRLLYLVGVGVVKSPSRSTV